ncbi:MAG: hypothetical protein CM1200mP20_08230 [Pseudomonadota bacterium]|nr:MAG: hypothetical protein CM1200mP20_08230 [Pseudomonadota bacterium]
MTEHSHEHTDPPSDLELKVKALESLLGEKGLGDPAALDALIDTYEKKVGPQNGARVVARAWSDRSTELGAERRDSGHRLHGIHRPPGRAHDRRREHTAGT